MVLTFALLGLSVIAVWLPAVRLGSALAIPVWVVLFLAAVASGLASGILSWRAVIVLGALALATGWSLRVSNRWLGVGLTVISGLLALGLALHLLPGFRNPILVEGVQLSGNSAPLTQYLNFDKGAAGVFLLAAYASRWTSIDHARKALPATLAAIAAVIVVVIGAGLLAGYIEPDLKLPDFALAWLAANLLFTCVAEESFFRGLVQERLAQALEPSRASRWVPVLVSGLLFGAAHAAGGPTFVAMATLAGWGYGAVYARTQSIEAAVLTHFALNAVHFVGFTYPHLAR
jgi:uncharacterized protein